MFALLTRRTLCPAPDLRPGIRISPQLAGPYALTEMMEPDPENTAERLRARARAVQATSEELRAHAGGLRERASRLLADTAALRSRLGAAVQPGTGDDVPPTGSIPDGRRSMGAPSTAADSGSTDGQVSLTSLGQLFERVAQTLEHSARLAEQHAAREYAAGRRDSADRERLAARHARDAAARSRDLARRHNAE